MLVKNGMSKLNLNFIKKNRIVHFKKFSSAGHTI